VQTSMHSAYNVTISVTVKNTLIQTAFSVILLTGCILIIDYSQNYLLSRSTKPSFSWWLWKSQIHR